ncbi:hypothetical protein QNA08_00820 [Chelatococcus sp. SYSU_G07232]|uniref:ETC complex I subunit n=1 Tax=Chelatococcus albus TaxID=3047466 RepID=A0ABT7ADB7_9HYPH|nr:hypothetical protein [Chelatococcus sp. SYSU_G07232]MDJ1156789.1 hypothetical protein [Chelatococcus sp. SYSU_G07232]
MHAELHKPARLQYWSAGHTADERGIIEFDTLEDAITFAMTQNPANRELAWARTASGQVLSPEQIAALWEVSVSH